MQQAVRTGKVEAGVNDNGLLNYFVSQNPEVEVVTEFNTGESYGFSVKKDANDEPAHRDQRRHRQRRVRRGLRGVVRHRPCRVNSPSPTTKVK